MPVISHAKRPKPSFVRRLFLTCVSLGFGVLLAALLMEGVLRLLPVRDRFDDDTPITAADPVKRFKRNATLTYSKGFDFSLANVLHTNNYGFVNDQDYDPDAPGPLLAVIGDSYVEAAMVPYAQTLQGRLAVLAAGKGRVYSFAAAGAPLSQYLAYARFARETFHPEAMLFVVVGNDFDESLLRYKDDPGFHYFAETEQGTLELRLVEYRPTHATWLHGAGAFLGLGDSALARYVRGNWPLLRAQVENWRQGKEPGDSMRNYVGQTAAAAEPERVRRSEAAVDAFFRELPACSGLPPHRCVFLMDGIRPHLYSPEALQQAQGSFFQIMRDYFISRARSSGYECVDLQGPQIARFNATGEHYEYPNDGHWNSLGHAMAAQAASETKAFTAVMK